ncbi:hypothetical protein OFR41_11465 [Brachyspira hyodysenteriae]|uniref:hypothetical protein n=1 Tax=Brachyspira hyodysenteriae TaxID=159 RepID=UPI0022CD51A9|nr:hypothetical protein [Brachyspira hyodysenteriae]MDA0035723.1 hypothetical protein [Brachyspira hyodysenteriae]MDA0049810.1 hypothetical protein [Brachyspira hyodysenteriae]MDA1467717.1 hypothetical protein [Brachyspira hyodysenteriae]
MKKIIIFLFLFITVFSLFSYPQKESNKFISTTTYSSENNTKLLGFFFPFIDKNSDKIFIKYRYKGISYTNLNTYSSNDPEMVKLWKEWGIMK